MTAIGVTASVRYWIRLFGYFLGLAVIGGGITAGGVYLLDEARVLSGGTIDIGAELAGGVALTALGGLLLLAGLFVIALNVVADGVRRGVEATREQELGPEAANETGASEAADETEASEDAERMEFPPGATASGSQATKQETPTETEPEPPTSDADERWKREVEAKLAEGDQQSSGGEETTTEQEPPAAAEATRNGEQIRSSEPAGSNDGSEQAPAQPSTPIEGAADSSQSSTPIDRETAPGEDEWVSGEDVREDVSTAREDSDPGPVADADADEWEAPDRQQMDDQSTDPLAPDRIEPQDVGRSDDAEQAEAPVEDEESAHEENSSTGDE